MFFLTIWLGKRNQNKGRGRNDDEQAKRTKGQKTHVGRTQLTVWHSLKALSRHYRLVGWPSKGLSGIRWWHWERTYYLPPNTRYLLLFISYSFKMFFVSLSLSRLFSSSYFILFLTLLSVCFTVFRLHRLFVLPLVCDSGYAYFWPLDFVSYNV